MSSSSSSSSSWSSSKLMPVFNAKKRSGSSGLQGRRPQLLSLPSPASSARPSKKPRVSGGDGGTQGPVIIYEHTPKAVHVRPDEFMALVQRLTGQHQQQSGHTPQPVLPRTQTATATLSPPEEDEDEETATALTTNRLVLKLGQQRQQALPPPPFDNLPVLLPSSPGPAPDGFLLSPGVFLFSPATMQAIRELIS